MAVDKQAISSFGSVIKDLVSALRDAVVFVVFLLLFFAPATIQDRLQSAGFTKGNIAGFEWEAQIKAAAEETKSVGQSIGQATENFSQLVDRVNNLETMVTDPTVKAEVKKIGSEIQSSQGELNRADRVLKRNIATQQQIVGKIDPALISNSGWIFIGKLNESKSAWAGGPPKTIDQVAVPITPGRTLSIRDDVYLHDSGPSRDYARAAILGVIKVGESVEVVDVDYSHAKGGGWFLWVMVRRL